MGLSVIPGGLAQINVIPTGQTHTIFHNCCSCDLTCDPNACSFKLFYATLLVKNDILEGPGSTPLPTAYVAIDFYLLGNVLQLDCFNGPVIVEPGDNITLSLALAFDEIKFTFVPQAGNTSGNLTQVFYRLHLGLCPA